MERNERHEEQARTWVVGVGLVALGAASCGGDTPEKKIITRVEIPDSEFKPMELESTVDTLVNEIGKTDPQKLQLGVVLKELTGYWEPVKVGANRAFGELGVSGVVIAPTEDDRGSGPQSQVQMMQEREGAGYDGMALAPMADVLTPEIDDFADAGTPVVTIDSDLPASKRQLYIGTINYEAGQTAGETLLAHARRGAGGVDHARPRRRADLARRLQPHAGRQGRARSGGLHGHGAQDDLDRPTARRRTSTT